MRPVNFIVYVLIVAIVSVTAFAGTTGKISGKVKDAQTGEPMIGANVRVDGTPLGAVTDIDGYYVILNVPPGKHTVMASYVGYDRKVVTNVSVSVDLTTTLDFELSAVVIEAKEVVVTAQAPIIKRDLTSSEARVDAEQIGNIPTREVHEVLSLQAGITVDRGGGIHIRGGRSNEVGYWVNGISVSDVYDGSQAVQVDNNSIQELQVISGTFNAEYGQAMSGIVNIVTKDGGQSFRGGFSTYTGYYATGDQIYYNLNKFRPFNNRNFEANLSGPFLFMPDISFYGSVRYFKTDGWLYGQRTFFPDGTLAPGADSVKDAQGNLLDIVKPDNPVPMNGRERRSGQLRMSYQLAPTIKLSLSGVGSQVKFRDYNHAFKLNPDGDVSKYDDGYNLSAQLTHTLGSTAFYSLNASYFRKEFREYLFEDPFDTRYVLDPFKTNTNLYEFLRAGTNNHHFRRMTESRVAKLDYTDQMSSLHQVKAGIEMKLHYLYLQDYNITPVEDTTNVGGTETVVYRATIPPTTSPFYHEYSVRPIEFSAYFQDKLEYENMIVNIGLRYDYFDSNGDVLSDPQDPNVYLPQKPENQGLTLEERLAKWYKKATAKSSLSPRFGISYPITDRGVLHFSYGHFLQIPSFSHLYQSPGYKVDGVNPIQGVFGNPDLNPQKTVMYEFGLQQQVTDALSFDVTGFYRDTRDWVDTSPKIPVRDPSGLTSTAAYTVFVNKGYANNRGVTLTLSKRPMEDLLTINMSYTFQVAEGNNSSPDEEQGALVSNREPSKSLTALDWDQTHTANMTVGLGRENWGAYLLARYGSGLPYTPVINQAEGRGEDASRVVQKNSRRGPATFTVDFRAFTTVDLGSVSLNLFLKVFNLLDRRNEVILFGQTGRASATLRQLGIEGLGGTGRINSPQEYITRADFYSEPREIQVGFDINF
ncbi:MAG: TonB-dependent receptor [Ignavibacteriales bacterium]|nr:TonB-dependent receptor [Ignavibacteriales bacterium]